MHAPVLMNLVILLWTIATWQHLSIKPIKRGSSPYTIIIVFPFIQSAVSILLYTRNAATASKPNVACVITILNDKNYSEHVLRTAYILTPIYKHWPALGSDTCCCVYIKCDLILENRPRCHIWYFEKYHF